MLSTALAPFKMECGIEKEFKYSRPFVKCCNNACMYAKIRFEETIVKVKWCEREQLILASRWINDVISICDHET